MWASALCLVCHFASASFTHSGFGAPTEELARLLRGMVTSASSCLSPCWPRPCKELLPTLLLVSSKIRSSCWRCRSVAQLLPWSHWHLFTVVGSRPPFWPGVEVSGARGWRQESLHVGGAASCFLAKVQFLCCWEISIAPGSSSPAWKIGLKCCAGGPGVQNALFPVVVGCDCTVCATERGWAWVIEILLQPEAVLCGCWQIKQCAVTCRVPQSHAVC